MVHASFHDYTANSVKQNELGRPLNQVLVLWQKGLGGGLGGGLYGVELVVVVPRLVKGVGSSLHVSVGGISKSLVLLDTTVLARG